MHLFVAFADREVASSERRPPVLWSMQSVPWPLMLVLGVLLGLVLPMLLPPLSGWHQSVSLRAADLHGTMARAVPSMLEPPLAPLPPCPPPHPPDVEEGVALRQRPKLGGPGSFMKRALDNGTRVWQCISCARLFPNRGRSGAQQHDEAISTGMTCDQASAAAAGGNLKRQRTTCEVEDPGSRSDPAPLPAISHEHSEQAYAGGCEADVYGGLFDGWDIDEIPGINDPPSPHSAGNDPGNDPYIPADPVSSDDDEANDGGPYAPEGYLNEILDDFDDEHPLFMDFMDFMEELEAGGPIPSDGSPDTPLFPGSNITVRAYAFVMLRMKSDGKIRDTAMEKLLAFSKHTLLPQPNDAPGSLHLLFKAIQASSPDQYEYHVCMNGCCVFDKQRSNYTDGKDDLCQCDPPTKRFKTVKRGFTEVLEPHAKFWYFGLEAAIHRLFSDPAWCRLRRETRNPTYTPLEHEFRGSPEAMRLRAATNGQSDDPCNGFYEIGFDFGQVHSFKQHSCGLLALRCVDIPATHRNRRGFSLPLLVIPGAREPANLDPYFQLFLRDFRRFGPDIGTCSGEWEDPGGKLMVQEAIASNDGTNTTLFSPPFRHRLILTGIAADTPGGRKLSNMTSHTGYSGCPYCLLKGTRGKTGGMYFCGYSKPTETRLPLELKGHALFQGIPDKAFCGDYSILLTDEQQRARVECLMHFQTTLAPSAFDKLKSHFGVNGPSPVVEHLGHYVHYNDIFLVPIAHASLYGVLKTYLKFMLLDLKECTPDRKKYLMKKEARRLVSERSTHLTLTSEFGRPYRDIINCRKSWVMEEFLHFSESYSAYIFHEEYPGQVFPSPEMKRAWTHLNKALTHYWRFEQGGYHESNRLAARENLFAFAALWEELVGPTGCTYNLHLLLCRLSTQEAEMGAVCLFAEFWVERMIQYLKENIKFRTPVNPEVVFVKLALLDHKLALMATEHDIKAYTNDGASWRSASRAAAKAVGGDDSYDVGDHINGDHIMMGGKGNTLSETSNEFTHALCLWEVYLREMGEGAKDLIGEEWYDKITVWLDLKIGRFLIHSFSRCSRYGPGVSHELHAASYTRTTARDNTWVLLHFTEGDVNVPYIGRIRQFIKYSNLPSEPLPLEFKPLRAAHLQPMYRASQPALNDTPGLFCVDLQKTAYPNTYPDYIVPVGQITSKVFVCNPNGPKVKAEKRAGKRQVTNKIYFGRVYAQSLMGEALD